MDLEEVRDPPASSTETKLPHKLPMRDHVVGNFSCPLAAASLSPITPHNPHKDSLNSMKWPLFCVSKMVKPQKFHMVQPIYAMYFK